MPLSTFDQKALREMLERRHPEYARLLPHWEFCAATYEGGRAWFDANIFKYIKEGETEFSARKERAYRFNHTREIVDLIQKYIFKSEIERNESAPAEIKDFWLNATLSGLSIDQFMRLQATESSKFGRVWIFVDTNKTEDVISKADEKAAGSRVYAYSVRPQNVLDMSFDDEGELNWILTLERVRDNTDPARTTGECEEHYRLWMRDAWYVFKLVEGRAGKKRVDVVDAGANQLDFVPAFPLDHVIGENRYEAPGLIDDIAYLDRAVANYLSNLDAIIQDQTFSQLAMPAQNLMPGEDKFNKLLEMGTKRIFLYDGESGKSPEYLSPDPRQAQLIITAINKIINEIYHSVGMAGERTKQDNAVGVDNSSGVAKAYDFERLNSLLTTKSAALQNAENRLNEIVAAYHRLGELENDYVSYPDTFDVRSLFDEFTVAERLMLVAAPDAVRQEQMKQVIDKLFPQLAKDLKTKMLEELKTWPLDPIEQAGKLAAATAPTKFPSSGSPASKNPQTKSRQGQVTSETKKPSA